jgi:hypothetical protein
MRCRSGIRSRCWTSRSRVTGSANSDDRSCVLWMAQDDAWAPPRYRCDVCYRWHFRIASPCPAAPSRMSTPSPGSMGPAEAGPSGSSCHPLLADRPAGRRQFATTTGARSGLRRWNCLPQYLADSGRTGLVALHRLPISWLQPRPENQGRWPSHIRPWGGVAVNAAPAMRLKGIPAHSPAPM